MDKKTIAIIILSILLLGIILVLSYNYILNKGYQLGRGDLILDMNKFSYFPVIFQQGNLTQVKNTALQEICGG